MNYRTRTLWIPGLAMVVLDECLERLAYWAFPHAALRIQHPPFGLFLNVPWLLSLVIIGGLGAWWSRRAGGRFQERFFAGLLPGIVRAARLVVLLVGFCLQASRTGPIGIDINVLWGEVLIPCLALLLGMLPFLRAPRTRPGIAPG
jgi:hypothetical protein